MKLVYDASLAVTPTGIRYIEEPYSVAAVEAVFKLMTDLSSPSHILSARHANAMVSSYLNSTPSSIDMARGLRSKDVVPHQTNRSFRHVCHQVSRPTASIQKPAVPLVLWPNTSRRLLFYLFFQRFTPFTCREGHGIPLQIIGIPLSRKDMIVF